jgi:hypothetical protein
MQGRIFRLHLLFLTVKERRIAVVPRRHHRSVAQGLLGVTTAAAA